MAKAFEANFDGLVGPTHNYAGLSYGNIASMSHKANVSNPREAALQGLKKAKALADLGFKQGLLAPQERPDIQFLKKVGFAGSTEEILSAAQKKSPELLAAACSASSMWTANAATISPSVDSQDGKVHFTAANLNQKIHRAIEHVTTTRTLQAIFQDPKYFAHHEALPLSDTLGDEGAANHTRFCDEYGDGGLQFFVYGRIALEPDSLQPRRFPARHTREASQSVARLHRLSEDRLVFGQQNPDCIDMGAFHNDVVSVGNRNTLFYHEKSFVKSDQLIAELQERYQSVCKGDFIGVRVPDAAVPIQDAVTSYLFNSQLISMPSGHMALVAPTECEETPTVHAYLKELLASKKTPIQEVMYFDLRQSMNNGGGPACLRLRVVLTEEELRAANQKVMVNDGTYGVLTKWVEKHYRDRLTPKDLADPKLVEETRTALDELTQIMGLGSLYPFQR
jgi:succinylarginine dihydrolase